MKKIIVLLLVAMVFVSCAKKPDVEAEAKTENVYIEKNTFQGGVASVITSLTRYDIDVNNIQFEMYGDDYEMVVFFKYDDMTYSIRSKEVGTLEEFIVESERVIDEIENITDDY